MSTWDLILYGCIIVCVAVPLSYTVGFIHGQRGAARESSDPAEPSGAQDF